MERVLHFILENWLALLIWAVLIGGLLYRRITHQPFRGKVPPVGVLDDLPGSVTGMKQAENTDADDAKVFERPYQE